MFHDTIVVEDSLKRRPVKRRPDDSISSERPRDEGGNDPTESFSASEAGGDDVEIGGLDSAGEEEDETEGELMDLS